MTDKITKALETVNELHGETLRRLNDSASILHDLDLLDDWLAGKGYGEEAGLVLRAMTLINAQARELRELRAELSQLEKALFDAYYDSENVVRCWDNDDYIPDDVRINISWTIRTMRHRAVPDEMYERIFPTSRRIEGDK